MQPRTTYLTCAAIALASCSNAEGAGAANAAAPEQDVQASRIEAAADESMLTLSGKVVSAGPSAFQLDVGDDRITVEMDDWDWYKEGKALKSGDEVVVTGRVDKDLWERKKIEASSVYVKNLGVRFFANGTDEEDMAAALVQVHPGVSTQGYVTGVEGTEFTVGSLTGPIRVDMSRMPIRPAIKAGDRVYAWGDLDIDPKEKVELMARGVAVMSQDKTKTS